MGDLEKGDRVRIADSAPMANERWPHGTVTGFMETPLGPLVTVRFDGWIEMALPAAELAAEDGGEEHG